MKIVIEQQNHWFLKHFSKSGFLMGICKPLIFLFSIIPTVTGWLDSWNRICATYQGSGQNGMYKPKGKFLGVSALWSWFVITYYILVEQRGNHCGGRGDLGEGHGQPQNLWNYIIKPNKMYRKIISHKTAPSIPLLDCFWFYFSTYHFMINNTYLVNIFWTNVLMGFPP